MAAIVLAALLWPASSVLSLTEWHWHLRGRLRQAGRTALDDERDAFNRRLLPFLPVRGRVGFVSTVSTDRPDFASTYGFLQYSLAPRQLVRSSDHPIVILHSPDGEDAPLLRDPQFHVIASPGNGLFVLRNITR